MIDVARTESHDPPARAERLQLAGELHDLVASRFVLICFQAAQAEHVLDERPQEARAALGEIKRTSTEALRELQTIVRKLRAAQP
jgi:signal transduction histidine kinase